jgi:hypothetical protein
METVTAATWIDAPPEAVWAVLTDLARYPEWTMIRRPRVTATTPHEELRWTGRGPGMAPGLLTAEHSFTLKPGNGGTLVLQHVTVRGFMVRFSRQLLDRTEAGSRALNGALKARVEARVETS